jgi:hypothetical protein
MRRAGEWRHYDGIQPRAAHTKPSFPPTSRKLAKENREIAIIRGFLSGRSFVLLMRVPKHYPGAKKLVTEDCVRPKQFPIREEP